MLFAFRKPQLQTSLSGITFRPKIRSQRRGSKCAFTLAEVLITLVIIGVIAALTVPNMLQQYRKQETSARLKKFYSTLSQAAIKAKADGNPWDEWANKYGTSDSEINVTEDFINNYLLKYLQYNKTNIAGLYYYVYMNDGSYFYVKKGQCLNFTYDINGNRKPNRRGSDIFDFLYCPANADYYYYTGKFSPFVSKSLSGRDTVLNKCTENALYCSALLMIDSWEFKDDYPYKL